MVTARSEREGRPIRLDLLLALAASWRACPGIFVGQYYADQLIQALGLPSNAHLHAGQDYELLLGAHGIKVRHETSREVDASSKKTRYKRPPGK